MIYLNTYLCVYIFILQSLELFSFLGINKVIHNTFRKLSLTRDTTIVKKVLDKEI